MQFIITEDQHRLLIETGFLDQAYNLGNKAINTATNTAKKVAGNVTNTLVAAGDKVGLGTLKSDWWYLVPGLGNLKMSYDTVKGLRQMGKQTFEQNMELIRQVASGNVGTGVAAALDAIGVGEIVEPGFWSLFFNYDSWMASTGKVNILYIILDFIGVATAGVGGKFAKQWLNKLGWTKKFGVEELTQTMKTKMPTFFNYLLKLLKNVSSWITSIATKSKTVINQLINKIPFMKNGLLKIATGLEYGKKLLLSLYEKMMGSKAKPVVQQGVSQVSDIVKGQVTDTGKEKVTDYASSKLPSYLKYQAKV